MNGWLLKVIGMCMGIAVVFSCWIGVCFDPVHRALASENANVPSNSGLESVGGISRPLSSGEGNALSAGESASGKHVRWGFNECLHVVAGALKAHKARIVFPYGCVPGAQFARVARRVYSNTKPSFPLLRDRYGFKKFADVSYEWVDSAEEWCVGGVRLVYAQSKKRTSATERKVKSIARQAVSKGGRAARMRYVHDYLIRHTAYATVPARWPKVARTVSQSSYGVLCRHRGTCHGYSLAFVRILKAAGVSKVAYCAVRVGKSDSVNHAICKVGNRFYDVTWDDALTASGGDGGVRAQPSYRYYARNKRQMQRLGYLL